MERIDDFGGDIVRVISLPRDCEMIYDEFSHVFLLAGRRSPRGRKECNDSAQKWHYEDLAEWK